MEHTLVDCVGCINYENGEVTEQLYCQNGRSGIKRTGSVQEEGLGGGQLPVPVRELLSGDVRTGNA